MVAPVEHSREFVLEKKFTRFRIVALAALGMGLSSMAAADSYAYIELGNTDWGIMDLDTGSYSITGVSGSLMSGIGSYGGGAYGGLDGGTALYEVNESNGALTFIGDGSVDYRDFGSTTSGLYGLAYGSDGTYDLFSVNAATGADTEIGATGLSIGGLIGMSAAGSNLYYAQEDNLYQLSTTTGAATLIGTFSQATYPGAMLWEDGTLYSGDDDTSPLGVSILDPSNAMVNQLSTSPGLPSDFWGFAPAGSSTPGPAAVAPFLIGLLARRRRRS